MKATSIWTAVLTLTAILLSAILLSNNERQAQGAMLNAQPGFILMTTGANGGDEGLVIIDKTKQKMAVYVMKGNDLTLIARTSLR